MSYPDQQILGSFLAASPWLAQDKQLLEHVNSHYTSSSQIFREVSQLVADLNLLEYHVRNTPGDLPKRAERKVSVEVPAHDMPVLTKMERRMSIELMHPVPKRNGYRANSLTKAPQIALSNVSVLTKVTDLERNGYVPVPVPKQASFKDRFKAYQKRLMLGNVAVVSTDELGSKVEQEPAPASTAPLLPDQKSGLAVASDAVKALRRRSLVGEHLPSYIRLQLRGEEPAEVPRMAQAVPLEGTQPSAGTSIAGSERSRRIESAQDQRINNLLANSLVMFRNKESLSPEYNGHVEWTLSEGDKEYILPGLFTRSVDDDRDVVYADSMEEYEEEEGDDEYLFMRP